MYTPSDTDQPVQLRSLISVSPLFETDLGHRLPKECSSKSDQIAQSKSLIWVLTERFCYFVGIAVLRLCQTDYRAFLLFKQTKQTFKAT